MQKKQLLRYGFIANLVWFVFCITVIEITLDVSIACLGIFLLCMAVSISLFVFVSNRHLDVNIGLWLMNFIFSSIPNIIFTVIFIIFLRKLNVWLPIIMVSGNLVILVVILIIGLKLPKDR